MSRAIKPNFSPSPVDLILLGAVALIIVFMSMWIDAQAKDNKELGGLVNRCCYGIGVDGGAR